jgi:hypothetical protein
MGLGGEVKKCDHVADIFVLCWYTEVYRSSVIMMSLCPTLSTAWHTSEIGTISIIDADENMVSIRDVDRAKAEVEFTRANSGFLVYSIRHK